MIKEQFEILIFTDSLFSLRQFCKKYHTQRHNKFLKFENLEQACCDGFFRQMVPILSLSEKVGKSMILWKMTKAEHFLELEYGKDSQNKEFFHR